MSPIPTSGGIASVRDTTPRRGCAAAAITATVASPHSNSGPRYSDGPCPAWCDHAYAR